MAGIAHSTHPLTFLAIEARLTLVDHFISLTKNTYGAGILISPLYAAAFTVILTAQAISIAVENILSGDAWLSLGGGFITGLLITAFVLSPAHAFVGLAIAGLINFVVDTIFRWNNALE